MSDAFQHEPVLFEETLAALAPRAEGVYVDVTLGGGGHAAAVLERSAPNGRLVGLDRDPAALAAARTRLAHFGDRVTFVHAAFERVDEVLAELGIARVDGILADVGVSSHQLDAPERGFSFRAPGPLDMRMDPTSGETVLELMERLDADALANVIYEYGEERRSRRVARAIKEALAAGELETTEDLRRVVGRAVGGRRGKIDPATRTFQGLRIAVNGELDQLRRLVQVGPDLLVDDGVLAIISFHSLEDRIVKRAFRGDDRVRPTTKKPIVASDEEAARNPRARSAKLRAATRLPRKEVAS